MIAADRIHDNGDGTLWLVEDAMPDSPSGWPATRNDRPCDTCDGDGEGYNIDPDDWDYQPFCPDCHGTGRHVFKIEVECECARYHDGPFRGGPCNGTGIRTLLVHVVPDMIEEQEDGTWRVQLQIVQ